MNWNWPIRFIVENVLWPILREIFVEFGKLLVKYIMDVIRDLMDKWGKQEEAEAESPEEKEKIRKKWSGRIIDVEDVKEHIDTHIDKVVKEACGFRPIPDTDSGPIIPLIPAQSGH